jgi:putative hydrolase of the HAD superfamily
MTRAVIFDLNGVLLHGEHTRPELQRRWERALVDNFGIDPDRFRDEFIFDIYIKKVIIGQTSLVEALDRRLPSLGYRGSTMAFAQFWLASDSEVNHELLALVAQLKQRTDLRLFIATNQDHTSAQWLWQNLALGELFEDMFYSARIGIRKPQRAFFDFVDSRIRPQSQPPLFFDDTPKVIAGARAAGWEAVQFDSFGDCAKHPWIAERLGQP